MCGIAGVILENPKSGAAQNYLRSFENTLRHRGPDGTGPHLELHRAFLNLRLAIVDRSGGDQPMYSADGNIGIVYNGEVYNFPELRAELEAKGAVFNTHCDTEVILRMYEVYGEASFARLKGMFAFCVWKNSEQEVLLVRDHFGMKPLYFYRDPQKIIFASELKGILRAPEVSVTLNPHGIRDYLQFRYIQAPLTIFNEIRRLDAGTFLRIKRGEVSQHTYWLPEYQPQSAAIDLQSSITELDNHFREAVRSQLMGEVPIGVLLSGGIDSSAVATYVSELGADLTTFNIGFPEVNEFEYSRIVAKTAGLKHVEITTTAEELTARFEAVLEALDEPIADPACFPLYALAEELKKHVTVVLSGEGGDELFGGYPQYKLALQPAGSIEGGYERFLQHSHYFMDADTLMKDKWLPPRHLRHFKFYAEPTPINSMLSYDMRTWMPENLMMKADKIMMAHSLEGRFPFLDLDLFNYAAKLPESWKVDAAGTGKWILKELMRRKLPAEIIDRPKMGFSVPIELFLRETRERIFDALSTLKGTELREHIDLDQVERLALEYYRDKLHSPLKVWTLGILLCWLNTHGKLS